MTSGFPALGKGMEMDLNKNNIKKILGIIAFAILLFVGLEHLQLVLDMAGSLFSLVFPFVMGACIAFILNVPMRFFEEKLLTRKPKPGAPEGQGHPVLRKLRRPVSLVLTLVFGLGVIAIVVFLVVPELGRTLQTLMDQVPKFLSDVTKKAQSLWDENPQIVEMLSKIEINWEKISEGMILWVKNSGTSFLNSTMGVASSIIGGVVSFFVGFVFALYILLQKEKLSRQVKQIFYSFLPVAAADKILSIGALANRTFSRFLSGQCLEAVILGTMFTVSMTIFRFPYALMVGVLIAFTALIPMFGAFIGCFLGAFLMLMVDPMKAVWFIVLFLILQQVEGNLIYPYVVGNSVGLPSIWVLAAVTIGGSMMGIAGMLIFIPLCSVLYALLRELVYKRLQRRSVSEEKWKQPVKVELTPPSEPPPPPKPPLKQRIKRRK